MDDIARDVVQRQAHNEYVVARGGFNWAELEPEVRAQILRRVGVGRRRVHLQTYGEVYLQEFDWQVCTCASSSSSSAHASKSSLFKPHHAINKSLFKRWLNVTCSRAAPGHSA